MISFEGELWYNCANENADAMLEASVGVSQCLRRTPAMSKYTTRNCDICGKEYNVKPSELAKGWGRTCSFGCGRKLSAQKQAATHRGGHQVSFDPVTNTFRIPLTRGHFAIIDAIDSDLAEFPWYALEYNNSVYVMRRRGRGSVGIHHLILERILGRPLTKGEMPDHKNLRPLDNRRENIRLANKSQNMANRRTFSNNTSGVKGVHWKASKKLWVVRVQVNNKRIYVGSFKLLDDARRAYEAAAQLHFGEFANIEREGEG
jgi:hypothetical protein